MAIKSIFKSYIPSLNYLTKAGKALVFIEGKFMTDIKEEIKELEDEIKSGHPHLFIDPNEKEIDTTLQDKIKQAQQEATLKAIADHNAQNSADASGAKVITQGTGAGVAGAVTQASVTMSPATLLGVTSSASLGTLAAASNSK